MTNASRPENSAPPQVGIVVGASSDWETMRVASEVLSDFEIPHECKTFPIHRDLHDLIEYAACAESRGLRVIIAGGKGAQLPSLIAANTTIPVLGVPLQSPSLHGMDSLLAMTQMPRGLPVGALAIGEAGAANAALFAASVLALADSAVRDRLRVFREQQTRKVLDDRLS